MSQISIRYRSLNKNKRQNKAAPGQTFGAVFVFNAVHAMNIPDYGQDQTPLRLLFSAFLQIILDTSI